MVRINRGGHSSLTEAIKKTASQNRLTEADFLLTEVVKKPHRLIIYGGGHV
jgi:hypothetical protein